MSLVLNVAGAPSITLAHAPPSMPDDDIYLEATLIEDGPPILSNITLEDADPELAAELFAFAYGDDIWSRFREMYDESAPTRFMIAHLAPLELVQIVSAATHEAAEQTRAAQLAQQAHKRKQTGAWQAHWEAEAQAADERMRAVYDALQAFGVDPADALQEYKDARAAAEADYEEARQAHDLLVDARTVAARHASDGVADAAHEVTCLAVTESGREMRATYARYIAAMDTAKAVLDQEDGQDEALAGRLAFACLGTTNLNDADPEDLDRLRYVLGH